MIYSAVIFDLFGTLIDDFMASAGRVHEEMAAALAISSEQFIEPWNRTLEMRITGAFPTVEANIEHALKAIGVAARPDQLREAVEVRMKYIRKALEPRPDAVETLVQVKHLGYRLGLISNCSMEIPMLWRETAFAELIDEPVFSSDVGLKKPDLRIYQLACERLGADPASCLYIADGEDHELSAAAEVGLHPVLISTSDRSRSRSHAEAREWQGTTISSLSESVALLADRGSGNR